MQLLISTNQKDKGNEKRANWRYERMDEVTSDRVLDGRGVGRWGDGRGVQV